MLIAAGRWPGKNGESGLHRHRLVSIDVSPPFTVLA